MEVTYNGLWKILIDKNMNKKDLSEKVAFPLLQFLKWEEVSLSQWMSFIELDRL